MAIPLIPTHTSAVPSDLAGYRLLDSSEAATVLGIPLATLRTWRSRRPGYGMVDDLLAALALEAKDAILARSRETTRTQRRIVDDWLATEKRVSWVRPSAGTTAMLRYDSDLLSRDFCVGLLAETGVLLTPGSALDAEGYLRLGYAGNRGELTAGLPLISQCLDAARRLPQGQHRRRGIGARATFLLACS